jgi:benzylsuccinate CoA-transferase BbsF subunit
MFAAFNANKLAITLNMKHADARALALRLVRWADVVAENFAPGAMGRWGLAYEDLVREKPDLVMVSTCLHGQTGPERDYPGFGGQGAAISGFNHLTGWPDREPLGPYGTITDSLSPRFAAAAVMAALLRRNRTGEGTYLDLSQVECAIYCLGPQLVEHAVTGVAPARLGNRSARALPHGVFRCAGEDRWIAIAVWSDEEWETLASTLSLAPEESWEHLDGRLAQPDLVEAAIEEKTWLLDRDQLAASLRSAGIEATPVLDLDDLNHDEQLQHRRHFVSLSHRVIGAQNYEALGFRLADSSPAFTRPGPTLGRDNEEVYKGLLGMGDEEFKAFEAAGAFE